MANGLPTMAADLLLKGCRKLIKPPKITTIAVNAGPTGRTARRFVFTHETHVFRMLCYQGLLMNVEHRAKGQPYHTVSLATSLSGITLLQAWANRKSFKPFYDAYCSHINETTFKKMRVIEMMDGHADRAVPPWIKNYDSLTRPIEDGAFDEATF